MKLHLPKTKTVVFVETNTEDTMKENGEDIQNVEELAYLGSSVTYDLAGFILNRKSKIP